MARVMACDTGGEGRAVMVLVPVADAML